jgi:hypothetical protein
MINTQLTLSFAALGATAVTLPKLLPKLGVRSGAILAVQIVALNALYLTNAYCFSSSWNDGLNLKNIGSDLLSGAIGGLTGAMFAAKILTT